MNKKAFSHFKFKFMHKINHKCFEDIKSQVRKLSGECVLEIVK